MSMCSASVFVVASILWHEATVHRKCISRWCATSSPSSSKSSSQYLATHLPYGLTGMAACSSNLTSRRAESRSRRPSACDPLTTRKNDRTSQDFPTPNVPGLSFHSWRTPGPKDGTKTLCWCRALTRERPTTRAAGSSVGARARRAEFALHAVPRRTQCLSEGVIRWHDHGHGSGITRYFDAQDGVRYPAS